MSELTAPVAPIIEKKIEQLGRTRIDPYAWMKDDNWQKVLRDPSVLRADIRAHLEAENAYTASVLQSTEALQAEIFEEIKGRIKQDESSVPRPHGPYEYYARYNEGAQQPIYARRRIGNSEEEILLDVDTLAKSHDFFKVIGAEHSNDHELFAYAEDAQGSEVFRVRVRDIASGTEMGEAIESCTGDFALSPCAKYIFWIFRDDHGRPRHVSRRPVGGNATDDVKIYEEADEGFFIHLSVTQSRGYIVIGSGNHETSEAYIIPANNPTASPKIVAPRAEGTMYDIEHWNGQWIIHTNADGAIDFKLMAAPETDPSRANWKDWIPYLPGRYIVGITALKNYLIRQERVDANTRIMITGRDGSEQPLAVDEEAFALHLDGAYEFDTPILPYIYESPTQPKQWIDLNLETGERILRKTQEVPSGHDASRYVARRLFARAPDGEEVPVTVLMLKSTKLDGSAPLLLYGYGSYGHSIDPTFSVVNLSLVDRGWIYAIAHVRGGSEKGWSWFLDGRGAKKPNTFTDFIAAAEHLIDNGYGAKGRIVANGGSAGGMLMGAIANLRPDLWAGVAAIVPFVDVLNTISDATLPLTPPEWPEWGNPLTDEAAYDLIASYSPYDQISAQDYPAILAMGGLSDPRVTYWEPAKWIARLRAAMTGGGPVMLRTNMGAGHGGASGRFDRLQEVALHYAFALACVEGRLEGAA
jgi:oligopeptidase B